MSFVKINSPFDWFHRFDGKENFDEFHAYYIQNKESLRYALLRAVIFERSHPLYDLRVKQWEVIMEDRINVELLTKKYGRQLREMALKIQDDEFAQYLLEHQIS